jgi:hypothetical protein
MEIVGLWEHRMRRSSVLATSAALAFLMVCAGAFAEDSVPQPPPQQQPSTAPTNPQENHPIPQDGYTAQEIVNVAGNFFGETTEGLAKVIERVFAEQGKPVAYITGEEASGAIGVGLRYGRGNLIYPDGGNMPVFWQGPSIGWDFGGNASKVFTLVYKLQNTHDLFQRYPGVDGSLYFVAGVGVNYQRNADITLAPIRTGVGLRAGANVGYLHYTMKESWIPF